MRPKATSGSTITGMVMSTKPDSRGLVTTIMAADPANRRKLRSAIDTDVPTALLIWVVSAVRREIISPVLATSKKSGDNRGRWAETAARKSAPTPPPETVAKEERRPAGP